jgi:matrixin
VTITPMQANRAGASLVIVLMIAPNLAAFVPRTLHNRYPSDVVGLVMKWDLAAYQDAAIPYWINPTIPAGFTPFEPTSSRDAILEKVQNAFRAWENVPTSAVKFRFAGLTDAREATDGRMVVSFSASPPRGGPIDTGCRAADRNSPATGAAGSILPRSFAGQILECDPVIHPWPVDRATAWWVGDTPPPLAAPGTRQTRMDLQGLLTHEIGHVLGLDHSATAETATMTIWNSAGESVGGYTVRTLSTDDSIGISVLYPTAEFLRTTGSIAGTVRRAQDGSPVFGAHVVAMEAATGIIVAGGATGLDELGSDGMPRRFRQGSGRYVLPGLPPGVYRLYAEPFDGPDTNWLSGVFGLSADEQFMETDFMPAFFEGEIVVEAGRTTGDVDVRVERRPPNAPNLDLHVWMTEPGGSRVDPALVRQGTSVLLELAPGQNIMTDQGITADSEFVFVGTGIEITQVNARRTIALQLTVAPDAPLGPHLLRVTTPAGVAFLSGAVTVVASP